MMKWRRTKSVNSKDYIDSKINCDDICTIRVTSEGMDLDEKEDSIDKNNSFSAYDDIHLDELYKHFRTHKTSENSLSELENSLELYQNLLTVSPSKNKTLSRQISADRLRSPLILPSIDEIDELLSIADSGISCDADDESEFENENQNILKLNFDIDSLKDDNNTEFMDEKDSKENLFLSVGTFKRRDSCRNFATLPRFRNQNKIFKTNTSKKIQLKSKLDSTYEIRSKEASIQKKTNEECSKNLDYSTKDFQLEESNKNILNNTAEICNNNSSVDHLLLDFSKSLGDDSISNNIANENESFNCQNTPETAKNNIKTTYDQTTSRNILEHSMDEKLNSFLNSEQHNYLQHSLMSSVLWSGKTSVETPSSAKIYSTMPPNRYTEVNKESNSQLSETEDIETSDEFKINLDIHLYQPEEILVTLEDGKLVVNGKHFSESEYGFECCQFHRRYPIPEGIEKSNIKSKISDEGILTITGKQKLDGKITKNVSLNNSTTDTPTKSKEDSTIDSKETTPEMTQKIVHSNQNTDIMNEHQFKLTNNLYTLKIDCKGFHAEDLDVRILRGELIVRATKPTLKEGEQTNELKKCYTLPHDADCDTIISKFKGKNTLQVEVKRFENMNSLDKGSITSAA